MRDAIFNQRFPSPEELIFRSLKEERFLHGGGLEIGAQAYRMFLEERPIALSDLERTAINLRFVVALPIAKVADRMGMSWDGADELLDRGVQKILGKTSRPLRKDYSMRRIQSLFKTFFCWLTRAPDLDLQRFTALEAKKKQVGDWHDEYGNQKRFLS